MARVAPSERFRVELDEALAGVGQEQDPVETIGRLGARLILQQALEDESASSLAAGAMSAPRSPSAIATATSRGRALRDVARSEEACLRRCRTGVTPVLLPTRRRRHAITETPPVEAALAELRRALGDDRVEMGELVILGAQEGAVPGSGGKVGRA